MTQQNWKQITGLATEDELLEIEKARELSRQSRSQFVMSSCLSRAKKIISEDRNE